MNKELNIDKSKLEDRDFINIVDLMNTIGTSQNTIYRLCDKNELKKYKFRGKNWFRTEEVKTYLNDIGVLKQKLYQNTK